MKRKNTNKIPQEKRHLDISQLKKSLTDCSRTELLGLIEDAKALLGLECSAIIKTIPLDVWKEIFSYFLFNSFEQTQKQLQILSCVWSTWSIAVHQLVQISYRDYSIQNDDIVFSDWVLGHLDHLTALKPPRNFISDRGLLKLTNLLSLDLTDCFGDKISSASISRLTSLTHLSVGGHRKFGDEVFEKLTNLSSLVIHGISSKAIMNLCLKKLVLRGHDSKIDNDGIKNMTSLTSLDIQSNRNITIAGISNLTNLRCLDIRGDSYLRMKKDDVLKLNLPKLIDLKSGILGFDNCVRIMDFNMGRKRYDGFGVKPIIVIK